MVDESGADDSDAEVSDQQERDRGDDSRMIRRYMAELWRDQWSQHLPLLISGSLLIYFVLKLMYVSGGNTTTARAILQTVGPVDAAIGIALIILPQFLAALLAAPLGYILGLNPRNLAMWIVVALMTLILILLAPYSVFIVGFVAGLLPSAIAGFALRSRPSPQTLDYLLGLLGAVILTALLLSLVAGPMWLPKEALVEEGKEPVTVYVLERGETEYTFLQAAPRFVFSVPADRVDSLTLCSEPGGEFDIPTPFTPDGKEYPECPNDEFLLFDD